MSNYNVTEENNIAHKSTKMFKCNECHKTFSSKEKLDVHINKNLTMCDVCNQKFSCQLKFKDHYDVCNKRFTETKQELDEDVILRKQRLLTQSVFQSRSRLIK